MRHTYIPAPLMAWDRNYPANSKNKSCLAETLVHEALHEVLWRAPDYVGTADPDRWGVFGAPYPTRSLQNAYIAIARKSLKELELEPMTDNQILDFLVVNPAVGKCKICE